MNNFARPSFRWFLEFEKHIYNRKHVILYGNIHDSFFWREQYYNIYELIATYFKELKFNLIVNYDVIDGFKYDNLQMRLQFEQLVHMQTIERHPELVEPSPPVPNPVPDEPNPLTPPPRANPGAFVDRSTNIRVVPEVALGNLRTALSQPQISVAAIIAMGDMLTTDPKQYSVEERNLLTPLKRCTLDSSVLQNGELAGFRNTLIILASDLNRIAEWVYQGNPLIEIVQVLPMDKEERRQFALRSLRPTDTFDGFYEGDRISIRKPNPREPSELELLADELADLTEGLYTVDLEALRLTSWQAKIPLKVKELRRLVDFFKFGRRDDPWENLKPDKILRAADELSKVVIGQPKAIEAVTTMLTSARVGLSMSNSSGYNSQPKGVFFFVGPTGVGKTELAKALTKLVFSDEQAFARFDMSEYKEEHAAEKLVGAPPGFVGYEEGGQLTNRVLQQPYSILLFDEIEKAHPRVLDKFLQILEDGRLTDGKGQTAYFNQTVIIFTSNIGASDLTEPQTGTLIREGIMSKVLKQENKNMSSYEQVEEHFSKEVQWYFNSRISRSELLGRFIDSIVVFDLLRPDFISLITEKFLQQLSNAARDKYKFNLIFSRSVIEIVSTKMKEDNNLLFGGRGIKSLAKTLVEKPLNKWIFENFSDLRNLEKRTLTVDMTAEGILRVSQI